MRQYLCFSIVFLILLCLGCSSTSSKTTIEGISYGIQPYNDLPVPQGFTFDDSDNSWAFRAYEDSALNLRSCFLRYEGDRDVGQLSNWYISQMPVHDWSRTSENKEETGRRSTLVFRKKSEEAVIDIVREYNSRRLKPYTVLTISLGATAPN